MMRKKIQIITFIMIEEKDGLIPLILEYITSFLGLMQTCLIWISTLWNIIPW